MTKKKKADEITTVNSLVELSAGEQEFQKLINSPKIQKFISNTYFLNRIAVQPTRTLSVTLTRETGSIHKFKAWVNGKMVIATSNGAIGHWRGTVFGLSTVVHIRVLGIGNATFKLDINDKSSQLQLKGGIYEDNFNL